MQHNFNSTERRKFSRFEVNLPLSKVETSVDSDSQWKTVDISSKGLGISLKEELVPNSEIDLRIRMPDDGELIYTRGKVIWLHMVSAGNYRAGIELQKEDVNPIPMVLRAIRARLK
jgi:hypothetical protein